MKNLTRQNPGQLFVAQELINKVKSKCCGIKDKYLKLEFSSVIEYIKKYSEKWGYRFWDDAIDAIAEAKKERTAQLANLKLIKKRV